MKLNVNYFREKAGVHKNLKLNRLNRNEYEEFIECCKPEDRTKRHESKNKEKPPVIL